ncbi:phage holin family protein [Helicobacter cetorum]|uniref:Holin n=1 Tax=Helicobacter cetorum (strain ATCC BAA-429 / MIT 00-7128) TaxID=182217 RepID=I0ELN1_HELC0|nr:phage holin family protein [Helicobacter cetorum]AFI03850.1 hypothetical protein HCW_02845 [Helicobacter cetorum MIT 00-7128]
MNENDFLILGYKLSKLAPYLLVLIVGLFVGFLYVLRTIRKEVFKNRLEKIFYVIQGIGSSMLSTWISFEVIEYFFKLPVSLNVAISGGIGYLGAESLSVFAIGFLEKRFK